MATYITREGDTADSIAWKFYGSTANQVVEQVLAANRGLADQGTVLPAGLAVDLPAIAQPAQQEGVRLWS